MELQIYFCFLFHFGLSVCMTSLYQVNERSWQDYLIQLFSKLAFSACQAAVTSGSPLTAIVHQVAF
jgi:hypothetical protein